ncbi:MAG: hypothetical protein IKQ41_08490 [Clostridia bacterium]|nr:hypothetical protein [Clostridia bacterium]
MKRSLAALVALLLVLASFPCFSQAEEEIRFITVQEWLDAKGECGKCLLLLKIKEVLNPVLAVGADETGEVNLYSGGETSIILEFGNEERILTGYWIVIANPRYNEFEGTVEMADWTLLRLMPGME